MTATAPAVAARDEFTVAGLIRRLAGIQPGHEMLVAGDVRRTWSEEYERACQVAHALLCDGVAPGDRVAFLDLNGLAYFDVLFGGALMGAVNFAVNWRLAAAEMAAIIDDSKARILFVHPDYLPALAQMPGGVPAVARIIVLSDTTAGCVDARAVPFPEWISGCPATDPGHVGGPEDVSLQLYTSGTTGLPKGVMLTNANLSTAISEAGETFHIGD